MENISAHKSDDGIQISEKIEPQLQNNAFSQAELGVNKVIKPTHAKCIRFYRFNFEWNFQSLRFDGWYSELELRKKKKKIILKSLSWFVSPRLKPGFSSRHTLDTFQIWLRSLKQNHSNVIRDSSYSHLSVSFLPSLTCWIQISLAA